MCPKCGPFGGYGYLKVSEEGCPYISGKTAYRLERCTCQTEDDRQRSWNVSRAASDFSPKLQAMTFATFKHDLQRDAYRDALNFANDPQHWLFFFSPPGRGKTHLMAAITHQLLDNGRKALYVIAPEMLKYIREGFDKENQRLHDSASKRLQQIRTADVLLLDDLGAEKSSEWAVEQLYLILDYRYREELPTVIASNYTAETLPPTMMRIADRLQDVRKCKVSRMGGTSYRKNGPKSNDDITAGK